MDSSGNIIFILRASFIALVNVLWKYQIIQEGSVFIQKYVHIAHILQWNVDPSFIVLENFFLDSTSVLNHTFFPINETKPNKLSNVKHKV